MRRDVHFLSKGLRCSGFLYVPEGLGAEQKAPAIVMAHGFSAVKEQNLPTFAEAFTRAGFVTLLFDYRFLGASEGEPRGQIFWYDQIEDYSNAITWGSAQPKVDAERIGIWGTSYSGAHVLWVGAHDKRVKAVVSQVHGGVGALDMFLQGNGPDALGFLRAMLTQDRIGRYETGAVNYLPVTAPEGQPAALPSQEAYDWFTETQKTIAPNWVNQVTMESLEKLLEYDLSGAMPHISPTPLLMIQAEQDALIPIELAKKSYDRARAPRPSLCCRANTSTSTTQSRGPRRRSLPPGIGSRSTWGESASVEPQALSSFFRHFEELPDNARMQRPQGHRRAKGPSRKDARVPRRAAIRDRGGDRSRAHCRLPRGAGGAEDMTDR